jgi:hypothetical protein
MLSIAVLFQCLENCESYIIIEYVSAGGDYLPAFFIIAGKLYISHWYEGKKLLSEAVISLSLIGYSNDEISLG